MDRAFKDWPVWRVEELKQNMRFGRVGSKLLSEASNVRVWIIALQPGERMPFHCHVLNYFWVATSDGRSRSHYSDGRVSESSVKSGDTQHYFFGPGESMVHDLENIGDGVLTFVTVEVKAGSTNEPLVI
jgi:beta-alanine degradation protein BauB